MVVSETFAVVPDVADLDRGRRGKCKAIAGDHKARSRELATISACRTKVEMFAKEDTVCPTLQRVLYIAADHAG